MSDGIRRQDELLQLLFWMQGESLGEAFGPTELDRLLGHGEPAVLESLQRLEARGLVARTAEGWRLTEQGDREGGRRFAEEFAGQLGRETYLTCTDPDCDCHQPGGAADCPHA